ncbi:hypothetical protein GCM10010260_54740 [Streptomyces filipinensis]|uniref:Uncharacterized protein n=1 Tax=Streptomyces filipinensis TaxID=66887 RepID=A0A918IGZ8_9ACTN|nr:hypothetical protein GCM10010260_54740 [Streptomyces filipinensis]
MAMACRQLPITSPKMRTGTPAARRWAATDSPYGPAPITTTGRPARPFDSPSVTRRWPGNDCVMRPPTDSRADFPESAQHFGKRAG